MRHIQRLPDPFPPPSAHSALHTPIRAALALAAIFALGLVQPACRPTCCRQNTHRPRNQASDHRRFAFALSRPLPVSIQPSSKRQPLRQAQRIQPAGGLCTDLLRQRRHAGDARAVAPCASTGALAASGGE